MGRGLPRRPLWGCGPGRGCFLHSTGDQSTGSRVVEVWEPQRVGFRLCQVQVGVSRGEVLEVASSAVALNSGPHHCTRDEPQVLGAVTPHHWKGSNPQPIRARGPGTPTGSQGRAGMGSKGTKGAPRPLRHTGQLGPCRPGPVGRGHCPFLQRWHILIPGGP